MRLSWLGVGFREGGGSRSALGLIVALGCCLGGWGSWSARGSGGEGVEPRIEPGEVRLRGPGDRQRLVVAAPVAFESGLPGERLRDATGEATFEVKPEGLARIDGDGTVFGVSDGEGTITARLADGRRTAPVSIRVTGTGDREVPTFERDVMPILTRYGCNSGPCHGKARGQNGFQLSLLGFDPGFDHAAIAKEARGRRVFPAAPDESLILLKGSGAVPHGGGKKLDREGDAYATLREWVATGMRRSPADAPKLVELRIFPSRLVVGNEESFRASVTGRWSDGTTRDVTHLAAFASNESAIAGVSAEGVIKTGPIAGEAAVSARFGGMFATCEVLIPLSGEVEPSHYENLPRANFIDGLVWEKLKRLGITASGPASDSTFLRRAYLDAIGRPPTVEEARAFLTDDSPDKRARLIDALLDRPEYADHWAMVWIDLLRPNPYRVGIKAVLTLDNWIRDAFRRNIPYDEFARGVVAARGSTFRDGAAVVFRDRREPEEIATMMSQLFLGIRLECAKCHHHPFEAWSQDDFYGFAAYFARVGRKGTGLSPPISGSEEMVFAAKSGTVRHPVTEAAMEPKPLFGKAPEIRADDPDADPRDALADWMTSPENGYFDMVIANRVWAELMGVGIVDPVDDLRATNPPSNGPLLEALAADFREHGRDLKHLIRTIMNSATYQLSSEPTERNISDTRNFSRKYRQRLRAETLADAIGEATGRPDRYDATPDGTRASAVWTFRTNSLFLDTFGRPDPNQDPPCERTPDTSVTQALHLMNSPELHRKITDEGGWAATRAKSDASADELVEELYLRIYSRFPDEEERSIGREVFEESGDTPAGRRRALEDLTWALLNTPEFVFKD